MEPICLIETFLLFPFYNKIDRKRIERRKAGRKKR